jgi:uncharacterized membrane protein
MKKHHKHENIDESISTDLRLAVLGICLMGLVLFSITLIIDLEAQAGRIYLPHWLTVGNVDDARIILSSILGAVSTVLALVFSVVLLVLSMAATQFGPRLLRRFILDQNGQVTIGLFCTTFLFSLMTLVLVRMQDGHEFIPQITTLTNVVLIIASFASLIWYCQKVRQVIQTGNLIANVDLDLRNAIADFIQLRQDSALATQDIHIDIQETLDEVQARCDAEGYAIITHNWGYLQSIGYHDLLKAASTANAVISLKIKPGQFVFARTALAKVFPPSQGPLLDKAITNCLKIGSNRTLAHDPEFAIAQIVEIASRALSSAINDPFTGIACIDWLSNNILTLANMPKSEGAWHDKSGHIRLIEITPKFPRMVAAAFDMIRQYGATNPAILIRMLQNFARIGAHLTDDEQRAAIMRQTNAIIEYSQAPNVASADREDFMINYAKVCAALQKESTL